MKILMINSVCGKGSTGRICTNLADELIKNGNEVVIAYGRDKAPEKYKSIAYQIETPFGNAVHGLYTRLFDSMGLGSVLATKKFIKWVKEYNPDIIHIHNLHGYYINYPILFKYLKTCGKKIIWTLHDGWSATGHCTNFELDTCEKWKTPNGCNGCKQKTEYPKNFLFDFSNRNFKLKKNCFTGIENLTLVTPSKWLETRIKESFLRDYPVCIINNGIDTEIFKPTSSNVKNEYGIGGTKLLLGVTSVWSERKGLKDIIKLRKVLDDSYSIVVIGLKKKQIETLPEGIIGLERTESTKKLAEFYSAADVYLNPTYEDNYPTTNIEAIACGTPVITYNAGGSPESALIYGAVVPCGDIQAMADKIKKASFENKSSEYDFSTKRFIQDYMKLYGN